MDKDVANPDSVFDILKNGVFLEHSGPFSVLGMRNGLAALAFESKEQGRRYINENAEAFQSRGLTLLDLTFVDVLNNYEFMIRCAKNGLCGVILLTVDDVMPIEFCERLGYSRPNLPVALRYFQHDVAIIQTRYAIQEEINGGSFIPWERFDILDYATSEFAVKSPFRDWSSKQPFYELRPTDGSQLSVVNPGCTGDWSAIDGNVPFFTSLEQAELFVDALMRRDETAIRFFNLKQSQFNQSVVFENGAKNGLSCYLITDLAKRISELGPFFGTVINPSGTRDITGYVHSVNDEACTLRGVSGNWRLQPGNELVKLGEAERQKCWSGRDTFFWNGVNDYRLKDLSRSFSYEAFAHRFSDIKGGEISEFTKHFFESAAYEKLDPLDLPMEDDSPPQKECLEGYLLSSWDVFTGEASHLVFDSIFSLIQYVWCYETQDDHRIRLEGASMVCGTPIEIRGSNDPEREGKSQESTRHSLAEVISLVIQSGYNPSVGATLSALINTSFKTMHAELVGHTKDVMWQLEEEGAENLCEKLNIPFSWFEPMFENEYMNIDKRGEKEAIDLIGDKTWQQLHSKSKHFVASGLAKMFEFGIAPQLDYSLISIAFVKAVEVELNAFFLRFSEDNNLAKRIAPPCPKEDSCESIIFNRSVSYFEQTKNSTDRDLTLGQMGNLLQRSKREQSEIRKLLGQYFEETLGRSYLTSNKFTKDFINKATRKYRNGGAHDSRISMETANECMSVILGTTAKPGVLSKMFGVD